MPRRLPGSTMAHPSLKLAPGEWLELPDTRMQSVFPGREGHPGWGTIGPRAVTGAWGGGAFDSRRNAFILTGGGHNDYGGNEVYHFELESRRWVRATDPSPLIDMGRGRFTAAGAPAPVSRHTYDGLVYLPNVDRILVFGGSLYSSGDAYDRHAWLYAVETRSWRRGAQAPLICLEPASDYDPDTGRAVFSVGAGLLFYDPLADDWSLGPQTNPWSSAGTGVIDTDARLFVESASTTGVLRYFRLDDPTVRTRAPINVRVQWGPRPGMQYHPGSRQLVLWNGGPDVWLVRTGDWTVTHLQPSYGPTPPGRLHGIYGRWQYMPAYDAFIGYAQTTDNVWLFRLPA